MADLTRLYALSELEQALVAVGTLLDGRDAQEIFKYDEDRGAKLSRAAKDLSEIPLDLRFPLAGTFIRTSRK
jgi:hypothetical protein